MVSWKEKMRSYELRQQQDRDGQFTAIRREMEQRKIKISVLEGKVDQTIGDLGIQDMLKGIRTDVWGEGSKIVPFSEKDPGDDMRLLVIKKGLRLVYEYDFPSEIKTGIYEKRKGTFEYWGGGGLSEIPSYPVYNKSGWHNAEVGYNVNYVMGKMSISTCVYVKGVTASHGIPDGKVYYHVGVSGINGKENEGMITTTEIMKGRVERLLLQDCLDRERKKELPRNLTSNAQSALISIQAKMRSNPHRR